MRTARRAIGLLGAAIAVAAAAPASAGAAPGDTLGVYPGAGNTAGLAQFESRLARSLSRAHDYLDKRSWAAMNDTAWMLERWAGAGYSNRMLISVPMLPDSGGTLAQGANGDFNAYFRTLAEKLVAGGQGAATLRIGPEFNGWWFRWTIDVPNGGALFAAYWRQIVDTMRSVPGASFTFDWCANDGSSWVAGGQQLEAASAYPGDAYVDYVGMDVYDQSWIPQRSDPAARWNDYVNVKNGLAWQASFAAAHGKPISFPEWGLANRTDGYGGGDSPYFVQQMYGWIAAHPVAYHMYFESNDPVAEYAVFGGLFPNAAATFIQYFGPNGPPPAPPAPPAPPHPTPAPAPVAAGPAGAASGAGPTPAGRWNAGPGNASGASGASAADPSGDADPAAAGADPALMSVTRARISRSAGRLDIVAPITRLASGSATVVLQAGGRTARFKATVTRGRLGLSQPISRRQSRAGSGIVTISYAGNADTLSQVVRLRAAPNGAGLVAQRPQIADGRLRASGAISKQARGIVRVQLSYRSAGRRVTRDFSAPITAGRWRLDSALPSAVRDEIDRRDGGVSASTLYSGYAPRRIAGEMRSHEVLGAR